jgi:hypothetical protein
MTIDRELIYIITAYPHPLQGYKFLFSFCCLRNHQYTHGFSSHLHPELHKLIIFHFFFSIYIEDMVHHDLYNDFSFWGLG